MIQSQLLALQKSLGIAPSKKMGQNFLIDDQFAQWIIKKADIKKEENILEVGPGFGALTSHILKTKANFAAIEFDRKLASYLRQTYVNSSLRLIEGDACKVDVESIFGTNVPFRVISNLPYSCGSVFIANMLLLKTPPTDMLVMLQKEVAERFSAKAGTEAYGSFSVRLQAMYEPEILRIVPPDVFCPPPDVDSAILHLKLREDRLPYPVMKALNSLVKASFAHRRKKMYKQAAAAFELSKILDAMAHAGVDKDIRAEKVTLEEFKKMAYFLVSGEK